MQKTRIKRVSPAIALFCLLAPNHGLAFDVRSDGSDGAFEPSVDVGDEPTVKLVVVDLSNALTGPWNHSISASERNEGSPIYGRGIYDPDRWAVVFKYQSVHIPKGLRVTFKNHPARAPVVWLVDGDVTIDGTIDLSGEDGVVAPDVAQPGPGGFRGGIGTYSSFGPSSGYGLGGGNTSSGGSFATKGGGESGRTYGNPLLVPLLGGSGGGGTVDANRGGGAGGGALLIACAGKMHIDGAIIADGGKGITDGYFGQPESGCGAGGGIRLIAGALSGDGRIHAIGGAADYAPSGGRGRIRLEIVERNSKEAALQIVPTPSVGTPGDKPQLWSIGDDGQLDAPSVRVVSVGGVEVPKDPRASFGALGADLNLPEVNETEVIIEATKVEEDAVVLVRIAPRTGNSSWTEAVPDESTSGSAMRFRATVPVASGYSTIQVLVRRP